MAIINIEVSLLPSEPTLAKYAIKPTTIIINDYFLEASHSGMLCH